MILVDKEIQKRVADRKLIEDFDPSNFTNIGYDLISESFTNGESANGDVVATKYYILQPGESVFVKSKEKINLHNDLAARVVLKNSRIRQGLSLDAPIYQPGHKTRVFFRVTNVSNASIRLNADDKLATIIFETLSEEPEHPYSGTFQNEFTYSGMGQYGSEYSQQIQKIEDKMRDLKEIEKSVYGNVITLMTIFIGIFSLVNINLSASAAGWDTLKMVVYNLAIIGGISTLSGLIRVLIPDLGRKKLTIWYWVIPALSFIISIVLTYLNIK